MSIYVIYSAWTDNMENDSSAAFGYHVIGVESEEEEAKIIKD